MAAGSLVFAAGVAGQALGQDSAPIDSFHQIRLASAAENISVAALYALLLIRDWSQAKD